MNPRDTQPEVLSAPAADAGDARVRRPLFRKYFLALFAAVVLPLLASGAIEAWFGYRDHRVLLDQRLRLEAQAAASKIQDFLDGIRDQMQWAVQLPWTDGGDERHRFDALRVLRQVPAIVDLALVDGTGKERLKISRVGRDVIGSGLDRAADPAVAGARSARVWHGPVRLNRGSEPYMTLAVAGNRAAVGVAVADINLKLIWDVISAIRVGETGAAFVVDRNGRLVAHPNISLVLRGADDETSARLKALQAAVQSPGGGSITTRNIEGRTVLMAMAPIAGAQWMVFAEQPAAEAYAPISAALWRTGLLVLAGAFFATLLAFALARRMSGPIRVLERGVASIGAGQFDHRIRIATGDELERLAARINAMAAELALSQERSERIGRLKRFLSPQVAELVESAGKEDLLGAQKADVVVVFCDLRGFTAFSAKAEPEEIMRVLGDYYDALGAIIMRHEATLTHFSGDGLMVLLNAPVPSPDDPALRAVRMARDMQSAVQGLIAAWAAQGHRLGFGVGLARGIATVGRIGYEGRHDYTAIGRVANLASRLCSAAEDRQILVDHAVATAVSGEIALDAAGTRELKGFGDSVAVYAIAQGRAEPPAALPGPESAR
ncbi:MAG: adenylate/guanylate cyclase domain-containing protein [Candidatus Odyssella sp.]|nr:adenylate/guanylate cyclase domain-containing protein [Candidatus Odyssella sp.]